MKIAFICTEKLPVPPVSGGAIQIYIEGILPEIAKHHEITVFGVEHKSLADEERVNGVTYIRVQGDSREDYISNVENKLDDSYDLIHVFNRPRWIHRLSARYPNAKFSLSLHNEMFHEKKISKHMALSSINKVEFITTVSRFIAEELVKLFPEAEEKVHTVYSGVDLDKYRPVMSEEGKAQKEAIKKELGIENKKVVLFVGRLGEKKGVDKLIAAMKSVMNARNDVALVIIGSKWYGKNTADEYTRSVAAQALELSGPVLFTGYLSPDIIPAYYNVGDVLVCPSQWREPLARVHYEAMAAGLPIITTDRGGNKEVVEGYGNGIVIEDYSNPDAFALRILSLLDNPELALAMGQNGRKLAEGMFSWKRVADDLLALINKTERAPGFTQVLTEQPALITSEAPEQVKNAEAATGKPGRTAPNVSDEEFRYFIRRRYPTIPDDVVKFLENYKEHFIQGELY
ncbi:MAG: glycosyltransferase family 4 protein [Clostridiales bacterium]|jgi:spore coat protein SA|nr:glycosyltransferase family 4 protein [Clostridiales bacterium]